MMNGSTTIKGKQPASPVNFAVAWRERLRPASRSDAAEIAIAIAGLAAVIIRRRISASGWQRRALAVAQLLPA